MYTLRDKTTFQADCTTTKSVLAIRLMLLGLPSSWATVKTRSLSSLKVGQFNKTRLPYYQFIWHDTGTNWSLTRIKFSPLLVFVNIHQSIGKLFSNFSGWTVSLYTFLDWTAYCASYIHILNTNLGYLNRFFHYNIILQVLRIKHNLLLLYSYLNVWFIASVNNVLWSIKYDQLFCSNWTAISM